MRLNRKLSAAAADRDQSDPREQQGAEIIDLATRNVLPAVTQRKPALCREKASLLRVLAP